MIKAKQRKFKNPVKVLIEVKYKKIKISEKLELNPEVLDYRYESQRFIADALQKVSEKINTQFLKEYKNGSTNS